MKNQTVIFRYETICKKLNTTEKTKIVSQKRQKKVNIVVGQGQLLQKVFADDGNRSPCVSKWMFSVCGRNIAHLTGFTTKKWPP